jgi:hypothetical protein
MNNFDSYYFILLLKKKIFLFLLITLLLINLKIKIHRSVNFDRVVIIDTNQRLIV